MIFALVFVCTRISQIVTLIPPMGMLAWFVNQFVARNALTPDSILILFILTVLALAWAVSTLFSYHRSSANARFVALVDVAFAGALIAAVYQLRGIADADCGSAAPGSPSAWYAPAHVPVPDWGWQLDKPCSMLKASWAFAIMNIIFFAATAFAAFSHGGELGYETSRVYVERRHHHHHHHHHRRHSSRHGHGHGSRSHSRGSARRSSHRSPHSHRRVYV